MAGAVEGQGRLLDHQSGVKSVTQQQSSGRAWSVVFAGTGINLCLGVLYAWSVFSKALQDQAGFTATQATWPYSAAVFLFAVFMVPAGRMLDRMGPRIVAIIAAILIGIGFVISAMTLSFWGLVIGFGLFAGAAMGFGYAAPTPTAVKWFQPHKKGMITGLVVSGYGLAALYVAPLGSYLMKAYGLATTFLTLGAFFTVTIIILGLVLSPPPPGWVPIGGPAPAAVAKRGVARDYSPGEMMKTWQFWSLLIMYALSTSAGLMLIGHVAKIAQIQGGLETGFAFAALLAIGNAGGRIITGAVSDKLGRTNTMILVFVLQALNMFAYASYTSALMLTVGAIVTGAAYGSCLALFPAATWDFFGLKFAGVNYGLVFLGWGIAGLIGARIAAYVLDTTGGYSAAYVISGILLLVAAGMAMVTKAPRAVEKPTAAA